MEKGWISIVLAVGYPVSLYDLITCRVSGGKHPISAITLSLHSCLLSSRLQRYSLGSFQIISVGWLSSIC